MTQRERTMVIFLLATALVVGGGFGLYLFAWEPLSETRARTRALDAELDTKETALAQETRQVQNILKINPRLEVWKKISLPPRDPDLDKRKDLSPEDRQKRHIDSLKNE